MGPEAFSVKMQNIWRKGDSEREEHLEPTRNSLGPFNLCARTLARMYTHTHTHTHGHTETNSS